MNDASNEQTTPTGAGHGGTSLLTDAGRRDRALLISKAGFAWLRSLQTTAPGPRLDLRYLLEGAISVLAADMAARPAWFEAGRQSLLTHLATEQRGSNVFGPGPGRIVAPGTGVIHTVAIAGNSGTGRSNAALEGASARTSEVPTDTGRHAHRSEDCKSLHVGEPAFQCLKSIQGTTRDPRLEMRYLLEGAIALLQRRNDLLPQVVGIARQLLAEHLVQLQHQPVDPFRMENSQ